MADTGMRRRVTAPASEGRAKEREEADTTSAGAKVTDDGDVRDEAGASLLREPPEASGDVKPRTTAAEGDEKVPQKKRKRRKAAPPLRTDEICAMVMTAITAVITAYSTYYIIVQMRRMPSPTTLWTAEQLANYNGSTPGLPLLLGCIGEVFDVSKGAKHYSPGMGYHHFVGRDASRAFITGDFKGDGLTDDLSRLTFDQLVSVGGWRDFYHKTYKHVGKLVGRYFNETGHPTKNLTRFERQLARAKEEQKKREDEDKQFTGCNSFWSQTEGGKVYCETGFPRQMFSAMQTGEGQSLQRTRCVCLSKDEVVAKGEQLKRYDECEEWATSCVTSAPEIS